jgi:hypothetical protein
LLSKEIACCAARLYDSAMPAPDSPLSQIQSTLLRKPLAARSLPPKHGLRKVVVLGAGVSRSFGLPLANDLLKDMIEWQKPRGKDKQLALIFDFLEYFYPAFRRNRAWFPPAEDVLAMMEVALEYGKIRSPTSRGNPWREDEVLKRRSTFLRLLCEYLWSFQERIRLSDFARFQEFVRLNGSSVIYITFNYDLLLESALSAEQIPFSYALQFNANEVAVLKPHGSINWFKRATKLADGVEVFDLGSHIDPWGVTKNDPGDCIKACLTLDPATLRFQKWKEPVIVPPTPMKQIENPDLKRIWASFSSAVHATPRLEIIGYSLPVADRLARLVLRKAGPPHHHSRKIMVVNPGRVKKVYCEAIWKGCKFERIKFDAWVSRGCA